MPVKCLTLINASSWYENLKINEKSSYLMMFCQFAGRYKKLLFGADPASDIFQQKLDKILRELPQIFGIADNIPIATMTAAVEAMKCGKKT